MTAEEAINTLGEEIHNIRSLASNLSEKETYNMNQAMRLLTVFSVIFLPLSLIAGIYGMNFQAHQEVEKPLVSPINMPELYWSLGYPFALGLMLVVAIALTFYFRYLGLLGSNYGGGKKKKQKTRAR